MSNYNDDYDNPIRINRDGFSADDPKNDLMQELKGIVDQGGSRFEIDQTIDDYESIHGRLGFSERIKLKFNLTMLNYVSPF